MLLDRDKKGFILTKEELDICRSKGLIIWWSFYLAHKQSQYQNSLKLSSEFYLDQSFRNPVSFSFLKTSWF